MPDDIPLPFTCGHKVYTPGEKDAHGNTKAGWAAAVPRDCAWWSPSSTEPPQPPTGSTRVIVELVLILDSALAVDHRDQFIVDGQLYKAGPPEDFEHGPWWGPNRQVVNLRRVEA